MTFHCLPIRTVTSLFLCFTRVVDSLVLLTRCAKERCALYNNKLSRCEVAEEQLYSNTYRETEHKNNIHNNTQSLTNNHLFSLIHV